MQTIIGFLFKKITIFLKNIDSTDTCFGTIYKNILRTIYLQLHTKPFVSKLIIYLQFTYDPSLSYRLLL